MGELPAQAGQGPSLSLQPQSLPANFLPPTPETIHFAQSVFSPQALSPPSTLIFHGYCVVCLPHSLSRSVSSTKEGLKLVPCCITVLGTVPGAQGVLQWAGLPSPALLSSRMSCSLSAAAF